MFQNKKLLWYLKWFSMYLQTIFKRESQKLLKKNAVYMGQLKELPMAKVKQFDQENK